MEKGWSGMAGTQGGDPKKLADALIKIAEYEGVPKRFVAGAEAVEGAQKVAHQLLKESLENIELTTNLAIAP